MDMPAEEERGVGAERDCSEEVWVGGVKKEFGEGELYTEEAGLGLGFSPIKEKLTS